MKQLFHLNVLIDSSMFGMLVSNLCYHNNCAQLPATRCSLLVSPHHQLTIVTSSLHDGTTGSIPFRAAWSSSLLRRILRPSTVSFGTVPLLWLSHRDVAPPTQAQLLYSHWRISREGPRNLLCYTQVCPTTTP